MDEIKPGDLVRYQDEDEELLVLDTFADNVGAEVVSASVTPGNGPAWCCPIEDLKKVDNEQ